MFILAIGMLARAAVGPAERLLNMLGERKQCAVIYAGAFTINLALCVLLIPRIGIEGAAVATSTALVVELIAALPRRQAPARLPRVHPGRRAAELLTPARAAAAGSPCRSWSSASASMKATSRGYSCADSRVFTKPWISAASASDGAWPCLQHDEGLDDLGAHRVGLADRGGERHRRMADQAILDLAGPDAEAGRGDDVVVAADETEIAVLVHRRPGRRWSSSRR